MKKVLLGLTVLATLSTATVYADSIKGTPYVGAQIGAGSMDIPSNSMGFAYRISGGYDFAINQAWHIAPEIGYNGYPDYTPTGAVYTYKGYNFDFLANVRYYVAKNISLIGKAGFAYATQSVSASVLGATVSQSNSKMLPQLGLGAAYDLNKNVAFNVTYNHAFGDDMSSTTSTNPVASVNTVLAGVTYMFN